jgi:hypothetical protein
MNKEYIDALEKTIDAKKAQLEEMYKDGTKLQKCIALREEISRKIRSLQKARLDMKKKKR